MYFWIWSGESVNYAKLTVAKAEGTLELLHGKGKELPWMVTDAWGGALWPIPAVGPSGEESFLV